MSTGFLFLLLFIIVWEILVAFFQKNFDQNYLMTRAAIIIGYILGWIVGRLIIGDHYPFLASYDDGCQNIGCENYNYFLDKDEPKNCKSCIRKFAYRRRKLEEIDSNLILTTSGKRAKDYFKARHGLLARGRRSEVYDFIDQL